jgi:hypothetical protein
VKLLWWLFGAIVVPLLLNEFTDVSPWLARKLICRAVRRLPEQDRPRWQEEWLGEFEERPGRLLKLLWALSLLWGAGEMGRMLGSPPVSEALRARMRAAWQRLRFGPKAPPQETEPEPVVVRVEAQPVTVTATGWASAIEAVLLPELAAEASQSRGSKPLRDRKFEQWLADGQAAFESYLAQQQEAADADLAEQREEYLAACRRISATWRQNLTV